MAQYETINTVGAGARSAEIDAGLRAHMNKVYGLMSVAMVITAGVAWAVGTNQAMLETIFTGPIRWVVMFLPLVMVFAFGAMINRMSVAAAQLFFYVFAAAMGLSIAWIFAVFTGMSITTTFLVTAIAFAGLSLYGYTTKRDLSGFGTFLVMGLIGLIVASVVNLFLASSALTFAISVIGVLALQLLMLSFDAADAPGGWLNLHLSGEAKLRLKIEALDVSLRDLSRPYLAPSGMMPGHG